MDTVKQKRSYQGGVSGISTSLSGVGARHKGLATAQGGGRYLDICTDFEVSENFARDPRLDELASMGVAAKWRNLAAVIGFDAFLLVWKHLNELADNGEDNHRVYVPKFDVFMRYQRNRYILSLDAAGYKPKEIQKKVTEDLGESVHVMHISRIIRQNQPE